MMTCEAPITKGVRKGQPATGTRTGYHRHWRAGERPCAACQSANAAYLAGWRADNPDAYDVWRKANPNKVAARDRRYRENHADQAAAATRAWLDAHPTKRAECSRRWRERHPDKNAEHARRHRSIKARVVTVPFSATQLSARLSMFGFRCWMCGGPFEHVDHVKPLAAGGPHCLSNLRPACARCNGSKGGRWPLTEVSLVT